MYLYNLKFKKYDWWIVINVIHLVIRKSVVSAKIADANTGYAGIVKVKVTDANGCVTIDQDMFVISVSQ